MNKPRLKLRIKEGDKVYLKTDLQKQFWTSVLTYNPKEMNVFKGQFVVIYCYGITYNWDTQTHESTITCNLVNTRSNMVRLPLSCINRSYPLIRNHRKYSLIHKQLYVDLGS